MDSTVILQKLSIRTANNDLKWVIKQLLLTCGIWPVLCKQTLVFEQSISNTLAYEQTFLQIGVSISTHLSRGNVWGIVILKMGIWPGKIWGYLNSHYSRNSLFEQVSFKSRIEQPKSLCCGILTVFPTIIHLLSLLSSLFSLRFKFKGPCSNQGSGEVWICHRYKKKKIAVPNNQNDNLVAVASGRPTLLAIARGDYIHVVVAIAILLW